MNLSGKELISIKLTMVIKKFFTKKQLSPICLQRKNCVSEGLKSRLSKTEVRVVHLEVLNHSNLMNYPEFHTFSKDRGKMQHRETQIFYEHNL